MKDTISQSFFLFFSATYGRDQTLLATSPAVELAYLNHKSTFKQRIPQGTFA
jgi:hypothetical protein